MLLSSTPSPSTTLVRAKRPKIFNCPLYTPNSYSFHFILYKHTHIHMLSSFLCHRGLNTFELLYSKNLCLRQDCLPRKTYPAMNNSQRFGKEKKSYMMKYITKVWVLFFQSDNLLNSHTSKGFNVSGHCCMT